MMYNKNNFYQGTKAIFKGCRRPSRKPDYISYNKRNGEISSEYWYSEDGVIRCSNHWSNIHMKGTIRDNTATFSCGKVASCYWELRTSKSYTNCGFASWSAFHLNR